MTRKQAKRRKQKSQKRFSDAVAYRIRPHLVTAPLVALGSS